jgi:hypothetical protein
MPLQNKSITKGGSVNMQTNKEILYKIIEELPEEEIAKIYYMAKDVKEDYIFKKTLKDKGVIITEIIGEGDPIKQQWENAFTKNISVEKKKEIYFEQHLWHVFSYGVLPCIKEEAAMSAFDEVKKSDCYVFYQDWSLVQSYSNAEQLTALDIKNQQDIYIVDLNFTWTYINTHEGNCGPYFLKLI